MSIYPLPDEFKQRLVLSGWSLSETGTPLSWFVFGLNGEHRIEVTASTRAEAWHLAYEKAGNLELLASAKR